MSWKKLLFPPFPVLLVLLPGGIGGMVMAMVRLGESHPVTIASYALAFYTLVIWCLRVPKIVTFFKKYKKEAPWLNRWLTDIRLRTNVTLLGNALWNGGYGALQLGLGVYHKSAWFYSLALYYASLGVMRLALARYTLRHKPGENMQKEWRHYRTCGWVLLVMNLALTGMIFFMVFRNRTVRHHEITTIAMAAYTFGSLTMAICNLLRYRKYHSPVFSASRVISLAAALVSLLTLESTMLSTFGTDMTAGVRQLFLGLSGGGVSCLILAMAGYLIARGTREIKSMENEYGK